MDKQVVSRAGGEHSASNGSVTPPPPTEPAPAAHISISAPRASETCSSHGDGGWPASPALARYNQRVEEGEDRDSSGGETELEGPAEFAVGSDGHIPNGHCAGDLDSDRGEQADTMDQDEGQPMCTGDLVGGGKPGRGGGDGGGVGDQTSGVVDDVAVEDLIVTLSPQKAGEIEEHSTLDENEASRDLSYEDTSNGQPDDSWSHVRSRRRPEEDLRASGAASRAIEQLPYQVPSAAAEVTNRAGRKMRNCRQGEQAVDVPRCSLQDIPASHAGPTKRPVRNVVGVNLGGGDSSGAGMVDLTEVGEDETPIETVRVGPVSSRTRRCPQDSSPSLASEGPAALSGETPVNLSSSGQPPARATVDSANRGAQRCVSRSEERSGGQYLEDSPSCGNDDELDTGTGDGEEIRDDIRADIRAGCAAGEASRSSLMHGTETPTAMQERRSSLGSVSNLTDKGNDELACEQVDAMDISMNVPTDDAVPGTLESSVVDGDAGGSGLCTETQVAEGVASGPSTGNGEGGGFEKERWVEVREPVVANRRKSRRVSDRARVDAGMDAEMDAMNKEQIPCMFMLDSTRGHRSQEVFKIVRK